MAKSAISNASIINHEQGHFDITEVFARRLNLAFRKYRFNQTTVKDDIQKIFTKYSTLWDKTQDLYDQETSNHRNFMKQKEWDRNISDWLKKTN